MDGLLKIHSRITAEEPVQCLGPSCIKVPCTNTHISCYKICKHYFYTSNNLN